MSAPFAPPPDRPPRQRRRGGVVGPLVLIFLGGVFLLQNLGYLQPSFWVNLWRLWPLVLVLAGIELLLAHRVPWPALALLAAVVLVVGALATNSALPGTASGATATASGETDLAGATQAAVMIRFGAGQLNVGPLEQPGPDELAMMTYQGPSDLRPQATYTSGSGGVGRLEYELSGHSGPGFIPFIGNCPGETRMDLNFAPSVPITSFNLQAGAADAHLDLSSLKISNLDMSIGAATAWLRLPESAGTSTVHISGGASTLTLEIPQGVAAQIQHRGGLSTLTVDQTRFPLVGNSTYRSPDYATAQNKVDINLETGVTTIQVS